MRNFVRHVSEFPIELSPDEAHEPVLQEHTHNVSAGGLCCGCREKLPVGSRIHVRIPVGHEPFESDGTVAWCLPSEQGYDVGIRFTAGQASRSLRLVELLLRIRRYQQQVRQMEGRKLSEQEAAREWLATEEVDLGP